MLNLDERLFGIWCWLSRLNAEAKAEACRDRERSSLRGFEDERHLKSTGGWLVMAHDVGGDGGVSRAYLAASVSSTQRKGWQASYPETTGYIIPTMLSLSRFLNDSSLKERAVSMADWEIGIQLPSGAVMGSVVTASASPAVFNTGQVILGWLAAFRESGREEYLNAALRAGDYLVSCQGEEGSWDEGDSRYALRRATTYNTRVAWAMIELGQAAGNSKYIDSGCRFIELGLERQQPNGWFSQNCLNDPERPLLHTIGYAARGLLESGICLNERRYIDAALRTLDALIECQRPDGGIPGRLASDWSSDAAWDCLTGDAQVAAGLLRACAITGRTKYREAARAAIEFVKRTQNLEHLNPGIRGGVKGSFPFDGPYGRFELLNWAAKFFCDALMMINDEKLAEKGIRG
jgi:uncharacterized protein YyaL (SSP411 family)